MRYISFAMAFFDNFFLRFKAVCSHSATVICKIYIEIAHGNRTEWVWNPFTGDITHTNASQSHHMNSLIDIHTNQFLSQSHTQMYRCEINSACIRAYSHQTKAEAKAKTSKNKRKMSKNNWKISKKIFAFVFAFAWSEHSLSHRSHKAKAEANVNTFTVRNVVAAK